MNTPIVGQHFDITPGYFGGEVIVTDVQITPTGFLVEGLPVDRDEDDYSVLVREFII